MEENAKENLKLLIGSIFDEKLGPIKKDIDDIKVNLNNHVAHLTDKLNKLDQTYACLNTDVGWLKKLFDPNKMLETNAVQTTNIKWLRWGFVTIITSIIGEAIAIIYHIFWG